MRTSAFVAIVLAVVASAGCGGTTDTSGPPSVSGVVDTRPGDPATLVLTEPSDDYYDGMSLLPGDPPRVVDGRTGEDVDPEEMAVGDRVEVWVGDACAESFPVQCAIDVLRIGGAP